VLFSWTLLLVGAFVLYIGAEWLVKGSAGIARAAGVRPLLIGLTVVAYGTSAPELTVGVASALGGKGEIAFGNSLGSNIANIGLILGITALLARPQVDGTLIRREIPLLILATGILPLLLLDGSIGRVDGIGLLLAAVIYSWLVIRAGRQSGEVAAAAAASAVAAMEQVAEGAGAPKGESTGRLVAITIVGMIFLVAGGKLLVEGAVRVASDLGMSERLVGLTIVAIGTSLPELAASLVAALRGHADLAVGNVVGSNLFNILLILGAAGTTRPLLLDLPTVAFDLVAVGIMTLASAFMMRRQRHLTRTEGVLLLAGYVGFIGWLIVSR
jgi:cation:H+ antiporter